MVNPNKLEKAPKPAIQLVHICLYTEVTQMYTKVYGDDHP